MAKIFELLVERVADQINASTGADWAVQAGQKRGDDDDDLRESETER